MPNENSMFNRIWNRIPRGGKASIVFFLANVVTTGITYFTTPLFTRLLTTEEYGIMSVFLTWVQVFGIIAMFRFSAGVFNNGMVDYPDKRNEYTFSLLILSNIITIVFSIIIIALYPFLNELLGIDFPFLILMCILFLFQPAFNFYIARQRFELKYRTTAIWTILSAVISTSVTIVGVLLSKNRLYAQIFCSQGSFIIIYIGFYIYTIINGRCGGCKLQTKYWGKALLFNAPLIPHYLSTYLLGHSDRVMISYLLNKTATAYYSVAYTISSVAIIVWNSANASLIPYTYEKCAKKDYKAISDVTMPILTVFASVCIIVIMFAPEIIAIMASSSYNESIYVIPPIVGGVFFQVQYFIYANVIYYYRKPKYVMYASVFSTLLNILLNYLFIPRFGYVAAGYTTFVCYLVQAIIDYIAAHKVVHQSIYDMKYLGLLSIIITVLALLGNVLYISTIVRYGFIILLSVIIILLRKKLFNDFKTLLNLKN